MTPRLSRAWEVTGKSARHFAGNHGMVFSASVAFNLLLSSIPILFRVFAAASLVIGTSDLPFSQLASILRNSFPYGSQVLIPTLKGLFQSGATLGLLGTLLLVVSSFSATDAVHTSLGIMLGTAEKKTLRARAAFHVAFVFLLTLLTFSAILLPPMWKGLSMLTKGVSAELDVAFQFLLQLIADIFLAGVLFTGGLLSYRYMAPIPVRWKNALAGSLFLLFFLYGIRWGFTFYVRKFSKLNVIYGSLFTIVCFIIVLYLFAAAYLFCASVIGVLERDRGELSGEDFDAGGD